MGCCNTDFFFQPRKSHDYSWCQFQWTYISWQKKQTKIPVRLLKMWWIFIVTAFFKSSLKMHTNIKVIDLSKKHGLVSLSCWCPATKYSTKACLTNCFLHLAFSSFSSLHVYSLSFLRKGSIKQANKPRQLQFAERLSPVSYGNFLPQKPGGGGEGCLQTEKTNLYQVLIFPIQILLWKH